MGVLLILASCGTTLLHRAIWTAARHGPAQAAEMGLALATFVLASIGVLLAFHGAKLLADGTSRYPRGAPPIADTSAVGGEQAPIARVASRDGGR